MPYNESLNDQLFEACIKGNIEEVQSLLDQGADKDAKDRNGCTVLHIAVLNRNIEVVECLIKNGFDPNVQDNNGLTSLHYAAEGDNEEEATYLIGNGADVDAIDKKGRTPLHYAAKNGNVKIVKLLVKYGADVNVQDEEDNTPLHYSATKGDTESAKILLSRCVNVHEKNKYGFTALHYAARDGYVEMINLLLEHGANVNEKNVDEFTALDFAVDKGYVEILFILLLHGTTLNEDDRRIIGKNPDLQNCLTEFEEIKAMPHLGKLIQANNKVHITTISNYVENKDKQDELIKEVQDIAQTHEQLSFVSEYVAVFLKNTLSHYNDMKALKYDIRYKRDGNSNVHIPISVEQLNEIWKGYSPTDKSECRSRYSLRVTGQERKNFEQSEKQKDNLCKKIYEILDIEEPKSSIEQPKFNISQITVQQHQNTNRNCIIS